MPSIDHEALYELAGKDVEILAEEIFSFEHSLKNDFNMKLFFENASIDKDARKNVFMELFSGSSELFRKFFFLMIDEEMLHHINRISDKFTKLVAKRRDVNFAYIESARVMKDEDISYIRKCLGPNLILTPHVNPDLIGGFTIRFLDGRVFDASVKGKLSQLKAEMVK